MIAGESTLSRWMGRRGEGYVLLQAASFLLLAAGPRTAPGLPAWPAGVGPLASGLGALLMAAGLVFVVAGATGLGVNLTALPCPKDNARLIETGAYAVVRHPMYGGAIWAGLGWALWTHGLLTLGYAALLFALFDAKASREERWLCEKFPGYPAYRRRVRKLIPFVY